MHYLYLIYSAKYCFYFKRKKIILISFDKFYLECHVKKDSHLHFWSVEIINIFGIYSSCGTEGLKETWNFWNSHTYNDAGKILIISPLSYKSRFNCSSLEFWILNEITVELTTQVRKYSHLKLFYMPIILPDAEIWQLCFNIYSLWFTQFEALGISNLRIQLYSFLILLKRKCHKNKNWFIFAQPVDKTSSWY